MGRHWLAVALLSTLPANGWAQTTAEKICLVVDKTVLMDKNRSLAENDESKAAAEKELQEALTKCVPGDVLSLVIFGSAYGAVAKYCDLAAGVAAYDSVRRDEPGRVVCRFAGVRDYRR